MSGLCCSLNIVKLLNVGDLDGQIMKIVELLLEF